MKIEMDKYAPPKISAHELWSMDVPTFNKWREENDFPRIVQYFIDKLPLFEKWMKIHNLERNQLIKHPPAIFIRPVNEIYLYKLFDEDGNNIEFFSYDYCNEGDNVISKNKAYMYTATSKKYRIIPYLKWARGQRECLDTNVESRFCIKPYAPSERKRYLFDDLELLDIGNIKLPQYYSFGYRNLEFININDMIMDNVITGTKSIIWYSSVENLTIYGSFSFVDAYKTKFSNVLESGLGNSSLNLRNGTFQSWNFTDCELVLHMTNSKMWFWKVSGYQLDITLEHTYIRECSFSEGVIKNSWKYAFAREFHHKIKILYSQMGKNKEAGNHYYFEKEFERKLLFQPDKYYGWENLKHNSKITFLDKFILYPKAILKSISLFAQKLLWGYGEKPIRIFYSSGFIIFGASLFYYINPASDTHHNFFNSVYSSITTFTTIGTGDIKNLYNFWLKIFVGVEALSGIALMGLLIAGFASKSKDY